MCIRDSYKIMEPGADPVAVDTVAFHEAQKGDKLK